MTGGGTITAYAQVNVESVRPQEAEEGFNAKVDGSLTLIRGNVSLTQLGAGTVIHYRSGEHFTFLKGLINYGEKSDETFLSQSFSHFRWTWMPQNYLGLESFAQVQSDRFRRLTYRQLYGGGTRLTVMSQSDHQLSLGLGAMFELERSSERATVGDRMIDIKLTEKNIRATSYLTSHHRFQAATELNLNATVYYQPRFDKLDDYRVLADLSLDIKLSEHFSLVETLNLLYDSEPPPGVVNYDLKTITSLRIRL